MHRLNGFRPRSSALSAPPSGPPTNGQQAPEPFVPAPEAPPEIQGHPEWPAIGARPLSPSPVLEDEGFSEDCEDSSEASTEKPVQTTPAPVQLPVSQGGFFGRLFALLQDGDSLTVQLTRVGDILDTAVIPHPSRSRAENAFAITPLCFSDAGPELLDLEFLDALTAYQPVRRTLLEQVQAQQIQKVSKKISISGGRTAKPAPAPVSQPAQGTLL